MSRSTADNHTTAKRRRLLPNMKRQAVAFAVYSDDDDDEDTMHRSRSSTRHQRKVEIYSDDGDDDDTMHHSGSSTKRWKEFKIPNDDGDDEDTMYRSRSSTRRQKEVKIFGDNEEDEDLIMYGSRSFTRQRKKIDIPSDNEKDEDLIMYGSRSSTRRRKRVEIPSHNDEYKDEDDDDDDDEEASHQRQLSIPRPRKRKSPDPPGQTLLDIQGPQMSFDGRPLRPFTVPKDVIRVVSVLRKSRVSYTVDERKDAEDYYQLIADGLLNKWLVDFHQPQNHTNDQSCHCSMDYHYHFIHGVSSNADLMASTHFDMQHLRELLDVPNIVLLSSGFDGVVTNVQGYASFIRYIVDKGAVFSHMM
ncbi:hypothetical protein IQ07DRAFT_632932 [Pyrenochaeta sp. DS3sAY3a]|nr:hypothetical protein IQ07DRAFT_632932 [Pyrenochaeta sp. DS3sAY3a]